MDRWLAMFPYTWWWLTEGGPWWSAWSLNPKAKTVVLVVCQYRDGRAVVPSFVGVFRIPQCIFIWWCPLRASGNPVTLTWQFWELRSDRILGCCGKGFWPCWAVGHALVDRFVLGRWDLLRLHSVHCSILPRICLAFAGQGYRRFECQQSCV